MKHVSKILWLCAWVLIAVLGLHFLGSETLAAEETGNWRPTYDLIMRWVNFGIIVFLLNKYAKKPLINFLKGRGEKVAQEIQELEEERDHTAAKIEETQKFIEESDVRFVDLKERIVLQGERKKEEIIATARQQSQAMLEDARRRVDSYIIEARNVFKGELVDAAVDLALERLPSEITEADNQKFLDQYLVGTLAE